MLGVLLPGASDDERKAIAKAQGARFEQQYLPMVQPFPAARAALQALKAAGHRLAVATDCKGAALRHYRAILALDPLLDGIACGEDSRRQARPALIARGSPSWRPAAQSDRSATRPTTPKRPLALRRLHRVAERGFSDRDLSRRLQRGPFPASPTFGVDGAGALKTGT